MFNALLDTYLKIFYSSFPLEKIQTAIKRKDWISVGIRTSCKHKRELHIACRNSNNPDLKIIIKNIVKVHILSLWKLQDLNKIVQLKNPIIKIKLYGI